MNTLTAGISRKGRCSIWQHNKYEYTLKTSKDVWFHIRTSFLDGKSRVQYEKFYPSQDYIPNGTLLPVIPKYLMFHVLALQGIEKESQLIKA